MKNNLRAYFPIIRERKEVRAEIRAKSNLEALFQSWTPPQQEEFLDFCTGVKGVKLLYDSFFKEILNPEHVPERMNEFLSLLLGMQVKILYVLPNDSTRIADETSLLIMDIVVQLEDGSLIDIEVQKIGYKFPGQRSACYSADLLLRQYKRIRGEQSQNFNYRNIKTVYTIVLFETSPKEFQQFPHTYVHRFEQGSDTGLKMELIQKYIFIPLDIFRKNQHNKLIENKLDAWLAFLSMDEPETIEALIKAYPEFKPMYDEVYQMCRNIERVMEMYSEELREFDRNTVQYMIDEMQETIDKQKQSLIEQQQRLEEQQRLFDEQQQKLDEQQQKLDEQQQKLDEQQQRFDRQRQEDRELYEAKLKEKERQYQEVLMRLAKLEEKQEP